MALSIYVWLSLEHCYFKELRSSDIPGGTRSLQFPQWWRGVANSGREASSDLGPVGLPACAHPCGPVTVCWSRAVVPSQEGPGGEQ